MFIPSRKPSVGIIGFGAFGRLMARHLAPHGSVRAYDPAWPIDVAEAALVERCGLVQAARCDVVVLAVPVKRIATVAAQIAPHLRPGALVVDVGSVKIEPAEALRRELPPSVDIVATHPLFGPQSAQHGIAGLKVVLCPVRGRSTAAIRRFLHRILGLDVIVTTPERHDRDLAIVQGLTHIVGRLVVDLGPLPTRLTTRSFEHLVAASAMVVGDAPDVFDAILRDNPYAPAVREAFFRAAAKLEAELSDTAPADSRVLTARSPRSAMVATWSSALESAP